MFQPVVLFIGLRYVRGRSCGRFGQFISLLSVIGMTLGVMALITLLSVMNGFERDLEKKILQLIPHAMISTARFTDPQQLPATALNHLTGVKEIVPLTTADVLLQSAHHVDAGVMLGITPSQTEPLCGYLENVHQKQLQPQRYNVILGKNLANRLGVQAGDVIRIMVPAASQFTPMGQLPSQRLFTVAGTFAANSEVDNYQLLVNQQDAARLMRYPPGTITGWRLFLQLPLTVEKLSHQALPAGTRWTDWRERKGELFAAVRMEKNIMGLLLSLIIAVAAFNIITSLGLLVLEKQAEVAILQTQGLNRWQVMAVFTLQGAGAGIIGTVLGVTFGILLASQLNIVLPIFGFLVDGASLPVAIEPLQVMNIALLAMIIALLSAIYPSWHAATAPPVEALRYE